MRWASYGEATVLNVNPSTKIGGRSPGGLAESFQALQYRTAFRTLCSPGSTALELTSKRTLLRLFAALAGFSLQSVADGESFMLDETLARGWENLVGRWGGPMSFRFLMQPAVAIFFAVRAGMRDARENKPPFLWTVLLESEFLAGADVGRSGRMWGQSLSSRLILDSIYQVIVHAGIFTLELLITATVLALVPYMVVARLVTRVARLAGVGKQAVARSTNDEESEK